MRVATLWFGRPAASPYEQEVERYVRKVSRRWAAEDAPLRPASGGRAADPGRVLAAESEAVRRRIPAGWRRIVLDREGRQVSSEQLASWLATAEQRSTVGVAFVVGSDLGLARDLREECDLVLSLSTMTLPHLLARLLLWEQLYRATQILGAGRYHRPRVQ